MSEDQWLLVERCGRFLGNPDSCGNVQQGTKLVENHKPGERRLLCPGFVRRMEVVLCGRSRRNCENC